MCKIDKKQDVFVKHKCSRHSLILVTISKVVKGQGQICFCIFEKLLPKNLSPVLQKLFPMLIVLGPSMPKNALVVLSV